MSLHYLNHLLEIQYFLMCLINPLKLEHSLTTFPSSWQASMYMYMYEIYMFRVYANRMRDPITARKINFRNCCRMEATACNYFPISVIVLAH